MKIKSEKYIEPNVLTCITNKEIALTINYNKSLKYYSNINLRTTL